MKAAKPQPGAGLAPGAGPPPRAGNIKIGPKVGARPAGRRPNPNQYWNDYYKAHDELPGELLEKVAVFRKEKQFDDVEAALRGYLTHRIRRAEPWMYEMLAVVVEQRKGSAEEVKTLLGYAAFMAMKTQTPDPMLSVASLLMMRGITDKVGPPGKQTSAGEMIDLVARKVIHRPEPLMMSIDLATKTKDPKRMGDAAEAILSLGWPNPGTGQANVDEEMRRAVRNQVETLAKSLREDGRSPEADALLARLPASLARDVYVRLSWEGKDDLDLLVDEPLGVTAQLFKAPRTIFGGAIVTNGYGSHPEEVYTCPRAFDGTYTVRVEKIFQPPDSPAKVAQVEVVTHEGTPEEKHEKHTIDLDDPKPLTFRLEGGRRKDVLPLMPAPPKPPVLIPDAPGMPAPRVRVKPGPGVAGGKP